jgi:Concanavalin A-like lectin/glucanases superfamily
MKNTVRWLMVAILGTLLVMSWGRVAAAEPAGMVFGIGMETQGPKGNYLAKPTGYGHKAPASGQPNAPAEITSMPGHGKAVSLDATKMNYLDAFCDPANYGTPKHCTITTFNLNKFTISAWVFYTPAGVDTRAEVMEKAGAYWMNVRTDTLQVRGGGIFGACTGAKAKWVYADSAARVVPNTWMHVATTYDGANVRVYVDGNLSVTKPVTGTTCVNTQPLTIGVKDRLDLRLTDPESRFAARWTGAMDDVMVFNRALSIAEIRAVKNTALTN